MNPRRLYRSRQDRQLAGVAAGMAEYLDIDPTVVRILWILAGVFSGGLMILAYIILAFVMPEAPYAGANTQGWSAPAGAPTGQGWSTGPQQAAWSPDWQARAAAEQRSRGRGPGAALIVGTVLVVFGVFALVDAVAPAWMGAVAIGPALVIALGAALLVASIRRTQEPVAAGNGQAAYAAPAASSATPAPAASSAPAAAPATVVTTDVTGTGYDADATSQVDLGGPAATALQPDTDPQ